MPRSAMLIPKPRATKREPTLLFLNKLPRNEEREALREVATTTDILHIGTPEGGPDKVFIMAHVSMKTLELLACFEAETHELEDSDMDFENSCDDAYFPQAQPRRRDMGGSVLIPEVKARHLRR